MFEYFRNMIPKKYALAELESVVLKLVSWAKQFGAGYHYLI